MKPILGIFLNLGDSFIEYKKSGRDRHWLNNYLRHYAKFFQPPLVFSYAQETNPYPQLIKLLANRFRLPRFLYTFLIPFFYWRQLKSCHVLRVKQTLGVWPALLAKFFWRIPVVVTYGYDYAHFAKKEGRWWLVPFIKITEWCGWKFSDAVIVTTPSRRSKAHLIPNGVDVHLFRPGKKKSKLGIEILTIGRLVKQKNHLALLQALAKLKFRVRLSLVGRGPLQAEIIGLARKLGIELKYLESVAHQDLPRLYRTADIFCLASHHEGSPKALLEAMSCGLPCVAADKAYSRFIIKDGHDGLLVKNNPMGLSQGIKRLVEQPSLAKKLGQTARQTIIKRFDNRKIIQQEINLLTSLIK